MSITEDRNISVRKLVSNYILQASCLKLTKEQNGQLVNKKNVEMDNDFLSAPLQLAEMLSRFVIECPEGGAVPQFIVGHLINKIRKDDSKFLSVEGFKDSVFGTNTTSKKPADVWEIMSNGKLGELYEITVKTIDYKRLDDCADSLHNQGIKDKVITFICN